MTLNIKDDEADRVVRALAEATGETITVAVTRAAQERLDRVRRPSPGHLVDELETIARRCVALPVLDDRTDDEILGYDAAGLPR